MQEAEECYTTALGYDPRCLIALNSLALLKTHAGEVDEAEGLFQRAVRVSPDHHGVLCNYAGFLQVTRRAEDPKMLSCLAWCSRVWTCSRIGAIMTRPSTFTSGR